MNFYFWSLLETRNVKRKVDQIRRSPARTGREPGLFSIRKRRFRRTCPSRGREGVKVTEPDPSCSHRQDGRRSAQTETWEMAFERKKKLFTVKRFPVNGFYFRRGCAKRLWRLRVGKYSQLGRTQSWAKCSMAAPPPSRGLDWSISRDPFRSQPYRGSLSRIKTATLYVGNPPIITHYIGNEGTSRCLRNGKRKSSQVMCLGLIIYGDA